MSSKRTAILVSNAGWGIYRYRGGLMAALAEKGWNVVAAADWRDGFADDVRAMGPAIETLHMEGSSVNPISDIRSFFQLYRLYRRLKPDLVLHYTIKPVLYGSLAARLLGVKRIVNNVTGLGVLFLPQYRWLRWFILPLYKIALRAPAVTIFQNPDDQSALVQGGVAPAERSILIPSSGVDTEALMPDTTIEPAARNTIVMASRMLRTKGVGEFVGAAEILRRRFPNLRFILMGGSKEEYGSKNPDFVEREWLQDASDRGVIDWLGHQPPAAVDAAIRKAAAVVLPSYYPEGIPRCLIEGTAAGVPIVTTDTPGCRETVIDGVSGYLCEPQSAQSLADAIARIVEDPSNIPAMGAASRKLALDRFDLKKILAEQIAVCEGVKPA